MQCSFIFLVHLVALSYSFDGDMTSSEPALQFIKLYCLLLLFVKITHRKYKKKLPYWYVNQPRVPAIGHGQMAFCRGSFIWYKIQPTAACHHLSTWDNSPCRFGDTDNPIGCFWKDSWLNLCWLNGWFNLTLLILWRWILSADPWGQSPKVEETLTAAHRKNLFHQHRHLYSEHTTTV